MSEAENIDKAENRVYELGFHFLGNIAEERLPAEVTVIKDTLESRGAVFISEEIPRLKQLSYPIIKISGPKRTKFSNAYFGWLKFEIDPKELTEIKKTLERSENILRFLLVKTVRESTLAVIKAPSYRMEFKPIPTVDSRKDESKVEISEAEIDKKIEEMVAE